MSYLIILYDYLKINYIWFTLLSIIITIVANSIIKFKNVSGYAMGIMVLIGVILSYYPIYIFVIAILLIYANIRGEK